MSILNCLFLDNKAEIDRTVLQVFKGHNKLAPTRKWEQKKLTKKVGWEPVGVCSKFSHNLGKTQF